MVKRYDYDTLIYKLKKFNLINEAKLLVFVYNLHDISMTKTRRSAIFSTINSIVLNIEERERLKEVMLQEHDLLNQKGIYFNADKVRLS